ncbi:AsmA-like C-terminal region-containing protein [Hymenobacter cellulosivorans]|uniref:AsmA-like C-terminal region-containing protein n=1 Tax=Hymenobacter cellulosivorans TaxID=2932249 RepID=A0ABY4F6N4_9BACT|nr:AsmA-like C-terminal region-containing protein [Hymenobacter cellulosivorans]UOQ52329.1 AsmA-like C-terminal region-containing protein [Hymenobacter cellulosivorans]
MKLLLFRRVLLAVFLLVLVALGVLVWLLGTGYGRRQLEAWIREQVTHRSELVLAPFEVTFSLWHDFPHLTASVHHVSLTDTSFQQPHEVLRIGRADMRLDLRSLWHKQLEITRLTVHDVAFRERVDSLGRSWGLHGKRRHTSTGAGPPLELALDSLLVYNFRIQTRNDFAHSAFGAEVQRARLTASIRRGMLRARGTLLGELRELRNSRGTRFRNEPVWASVNYQFEFKKRQGTLHHTRATLNGDTIRVRGTHVTVPNQPGTRLYFRFEGEQPLMEVLHAALPANLEPFIAGATSPSKAHIQYTISGLTGPTVRPRNVLTFGLRRARLLWPDPRRRINSWDLQATYDNGPAHNQKTTSLTVQHCRVYSSAGQLNVALTLRDFTQPFVSGRFRGRTELPQLAVLVAPGQWRARHGTAEMDVRLHGLLPPTDDGSAAAMEGQPSMSVRGRVTLQNASFVVLDRRADFSELNVRLGLQDSIWTLSHASGVLDHMRFQASATTTHLFDYLTGQELNMQVTGNFAVDELRVQRLRELLRPPAAATRLLARQRAAASSTQLATLGGSLIPPGVRLHVGLRCGRLVLPADTLEQVGVTVLHDGQRVELQNLAARVWGAQMRGQVSWPTDTLQQVAPIQFALNMHYDTVNYRRLMARMSRPPRRSAKAPASPALRELLLAANGTLTCDMTTVQLEAGENLRNLHLQLVKTGPELRLPTLDFSTTRGGSGHASAVVRIQGVHVTNADVDLNLHYQDLDVQRLLLLLASLNPEDKSVPLPVLRLARRAERRARRQQLAPGSILTNGVLQAVVHVQADQVNYSAVRGRSFELVSHLRDGMARVDKCSLHAFRGRIDLQGHMLLNVNRRHHPLQVQMRLQDVELPDLFAAGLAIGLTLPDEDNIRGSMRCVADVRTDLDSTFLPRLSHTVGYVRADMRNLELLNIEALSQALKFMREERTRHLYFEPFSSEFILNRGQLLIPSLDLNSNLSNMQISGSYFLNGRANLYIGLNPMQALFGDNEKRIERIKQSEPLRRPNHRLTYVNLQRLTPASRYSVRLFKGNEQRQHQALLRQQFRQLLITQRLDSTVNLQR